MQSEYANRLLYIATLALAKVSILSLLMILTAADLHRRLGIVLTVVIAVWGIASVFVAAFQCGFDEPWRFFGAGSSCFSMVWIFAVSNWLVTDGMSRSPSGVQWAPSTC